MTYNIQCIATTRGMWVISVKVKVHPKWDVCILQLKMNIIFSLVSVHYPETLIMSSHGKAMEAVPTCLGRSLQIMSHNMTDMKRFLTSDVFLFKVFEDARNLHQRTACLETAGRGQILLLHDHPTLAGWTQLQHVHRLHPLWLHVSWDNSSDRLEVCSGLSSSLDEGSSAEGRGWEINTKFHSKDNLGELTGLVKQLQVWGLWRQYLS